MPISGQPSKKAFEILPNPHYHLPGYTVNKKTRRIFRVAQKKYKELVGCLHMHSTYSDGSGTIAEITRDAREAGLDYIMLTDHNNLKALKNGEGGWQDSLLVIIGYEINDVEDRNHYLAFGLEEEVEKGLPAKEYVRRVKEAGGFGFIAHPDEQRDVFPEHPPYPWTEWDTDDYQGIEIWNQMSEWMENLSEWNKLWQVVNPRRSILAPMPVTLNKWDEVNLRRPVVGVGGVDAHAHKHPLLGGLFHVTIFRYKIQFKTIRTHLLVEPTYHRDLPAILAEKKIFDAFLNCRAFISNYYVGDARGFSAQVQNEAGRITMGETIPFRPGSAMQVKLPEKGEARLIRNGQLLRRAEGRRIEFPIEKAGLYRLEINRKGRAWIFSNHFRIVNEKGQFD